MQHMQASQWGALLHRRIIYQGSGIFPVNADMAPNDIYIPLTHMDCLYCTILRFLVIFMPTITIVTDE